MQCFFTLMLNNPSSLFNGLIIGSVVAVIVIVIGIMTTMMYLEVKKVLLITFRVHLCFRIYMLSYNFYHIIFVMYIGFATPVKKWIRNKYVDSSLERLQMDIRIRRGGRHCEGSSAAN